MSNRIHPSKVAKVEKAVEPESISPELISRPELVPEFGPEPEPEPEKQVFDRTMNALEVLNVHLQMLKKNENDLPYFGKRRPHSIFRTKLNFPSVLRNMFYHGLCDHYTLTIACIYIRRISTSYEINTNNINALTFIAVMIAHKFREDIPFNNASFSTISPIPVPDISTMEILFLQMMQFRLLVNDDEIHDFLAIVKTTKEDKLDIEDCIFTTFM